MRKPSRMMREIRLHAENSALKKQLEEAALKLQWSRGAMLEIFNQVKERLDANDYEGLRVWVDACTNPTPEAEVVGEENPPEDTTGVGEEASGPPEGNTGEVAGSSRPSAEGDSDV